MSRAKNISRRLLSIILYPLSILLSAACGGPKIIPDEELAEIFHDIYLVNAYVAQHSINIDSLNIYEPIFAAHGYTSEDVQSTIGNFSKRKSARLSDDAVEPATDMLRRESRYYSRRIEIRDTIALVARERYAETVLFDSLIRARRIGDTARLHIVIPDTKPGSYAVSWGYLLDTLDRNTSLRANSWLEDDRGRRTGSSQRRLTQGRHTLVTANLNADERHRRLVISLADYPDDLTAPHLTIDSLRVTYYLPREIAVERLARSWMDSLRFDTLIYPHATHLVPPLADTLGP